MPDESRRRALFIGPGDGRRALTTGTPRWQTDVATDVDHGLLTLQMVHPTIDAVIIDERLGVLVGHALLAHIQGLYPHLSCFLLRDKAVTPRAASPLFLPLVVPRSASREEFEDKLDRTCALQRMLADDSLRRVCGELAWLPAVPKTYWDLGEALAADASLSAVADIIQTDPAISAKVLQLVNRAFFGLSKRVASINQAVSLLGTDILRGVVLTTHVFSAMDGVEVPGFSLEQLQEDAIRVARLSQRFVRTKGLADEAFPAGLLHDVGKIVLALRRPVELGQVLARSLVSGVPLHEVERDIIGVTHAEAGAYLLSAWSLPTSILECVAFHHATALVDTDDCELIAVVHGADTLSHILLGGEPERLDEKLLERAGLLDHVNRWLKIVEDERAAPRA